MGGFEKLVNECVAALRDGHTQKVWRKLSKLNAARVTREWRLPIARLCRQVGLYSRGLALLAPVMNLTSGKVGSATAPESAEYGVLLLRAGAVNEAFATLSGINASEAPEALLYRAFLLFNRFEYTEAIPVLEQFLRQTSDTRAKVLGRINHAVALTGCRRYLEARAILDEIIGRDIIAAKSPALVGSCLSIRAQINLLERNFDLARADLEAAQNLLIGADNHEQMFFLKWRAFLEGLESESTEPIDEFRMVARNADDFAGLREADLYSLRVRFDNVRFKHLIFGTPFESFRDQVCLELGQRVEEQTYILGPKSSPRFDLLTGKIDEHDLLAPGRKCHQLFEVVLRDFYQPLRIGGLFSEMFPDEHFDVNSSPVRVRQLIRRARRWLESENIPVEITEARGFYSIKIVGDFSFRVPLGRQPVDFMHLHFEKLRNAFQASESFTSKQVRENLGLARTTVQRLVNWGIENGKLEKLGARNATFYKFSLADKKAA